MDADEVQEFERLKWVHLANGGGVWEYDLVKDSLYWDQGMWGIFVSEGETFELNLDAWEKLIQEGCRLLFRKNLEASKISFTPIKFQCDLKEGEGKEDQRSVEVSVICVRDCDGKAVRLAGGARDITAERKMARALRAAKESAESDSRAKGEFVAVLSHEIRTPLNGILGFIPMLREESLTERQQEYINTMERSGEFLERTLNEILDHSRVESGSLQLDMKQFLVADLVLSTIGMFQNPAKAKGVVLRSEIHPEVKKIYVGDEFRIQQILINLVSNAVKFTKAGEIVVKVKVAYLDLAEGLEFSVKDTGMGVPAGEEDHIFEAFRQSDPSIARQYGGAGLGLSIVRKIAKLMNGHVWLAETSPKGSLFKFFISLRTTEAHLISWTGMTPRIVEKDKEASKRVLRILLVDDSAVNLKVTSLLLLGEGHDLQMVTSGKDALKMCSEQYFDLILMDILMPELSGVETVQLLREQEKQLRTKNRHHPVIALTANADGGTRQECEQAGMDGFLSKPVSKSALLEVIERV